MFYDDLVSQRGYPLFNSTSSTSSIDWISKTKQKWLGQSDIFSFSSPFNLLLFFSRIAHTRTLCFFQKEHHHNLFSIHDETQKVEYNIFVHMKKNNDKAALSHQWRTTKNTHNPPLYNPWEREAEEKCKRTPSRWSVGCLLILLLGQYKRKGFACFTTTTTTTTTRTTTSP